MAPDLDLDLDPLLSPAVASSAVRIAALPGTVDRWTGRPAWASHCGAETALARESDAVLGSGDSMSR